VDPRAVAEYFVLFQLAQRGLDADLASNLHADVIACSPRGTRVALLRIHCRFGESWMSRPGDRSSDARNHAHVFVELGEGEPQCFVVPASIAAAHLALNRRWPERSPADTLEPYRGAWHLLGLNRHGSFRSSPVQSPDSPAR
jgi:hypothetical protein